MKNGKFIDDEGTICWYKDDELHREGGPASLYPDGKEYWYRNGKFHREDGPAVTYPGGTQLWCKNGNLHREDGPAIIEPDGNVEWWFEDIHYSDVKSFAVAASWTDEQLAKYLLSN